MPNFDRLAERLVQDEGLELHPYRCPAGKLTIGVGRNLDDKGVSLTEARLLLQNDISEVYEKLNRWAFFRSLNDVRQEVLLNMAFNMGFRGVLKFEKMIEAIQDGQYVRASQEMLDSKWAKQVPARAKRLADEMLTGLSKDSHEFQRPGGAEGVPQ